MVSPCESVPARARLNVEDATIRLMMVATTTHRWLLSPLIDILISVTSAPVYTLPTCVCIYVPIVRGRWRGRFIGPGRTSLLHRPYVPANLSVLPVCLSLLGLSFSASIRVYMHFKHCVHAHYVRVLNHPALSSLDFPTIVTRGCVAVTNYSTADFYRLSIEIFVEEHFSGPRRTSKLVESSPNIR